MGHSKSLATIHVWDAHLFTKTIASSGRMSSIESFMSQHEVNLFSDIKQWSSTIPSANRIFSLWDFIRIFSEILLPSRSPHRDLHRCLCLWETWRSGLVLISRSIWSSPLTKVLLSRSMWMDLVGFVRRSKWNFVQFIDRRTSSDHCSSFGIPSTLEECSRANGKSGSTSTQFSFPTKIDVKQQRVASSCRR